MADESANAVSIISLLVSIGAVIFSIISYRDNKKLAVNGFNKNFRPYLAAENFAYLDAHNNLISPMNVVMLIVINVPAYIFSKRLSYYERDGNKDTLVFAHPEYKNSLQYPFEKGQSTITTNENDINHDMATNMHPKILIRKISLTYTWLGESKDTYYFTAEHRYDVTSRQWDLIMQSAD